MSQKKLGPFKLVILGEAGQLQVESPLVNATECGLIAGGVPLVASPGQSWKDLIAASICHAKLRRPRGSGFARESVGFALKKKGGDILML